MHSQHRIIFLLGNNFDETSALPEDGRLAVASKRELPNLYIIPLLTCFGFGETDTRNFW
jgi:hypothetical protein